MPADTTKSTREILRKVRHIEIRTKRLVNDSLAGEYHSVFKGRGMDFDEVREYSPGDEVRTIDWNVTARAGRPFVKKFTEERELTILLLVDISASGNFGSADLSKRDLAAELASVLAFSAIRNSDKVGLLLYTDRVERYLPPKKGRRHVLRVVRDILYHTPEGRGTDSVKALDVANHVLHRRAIVFLISDFQSPGDPVRTRVELRRAMRQTNRRHDLIAVQVADPRESARMSNRASPARAAVAISLLAAAGSMPVAARASAPASTAASDRASAPVTLAPSTPEIFFPPAPARAPAPTFSPADTPARVSPSAPSSNSASAPASGSG